jgi:hypothetical protein
LCATYILRRFSVVSVKEEASSIAFEDWASLSSAKTF